MEIQQQDQVVSIKGIQHLNGNCAETFQAAAQMAKAGIAAIEIDLSQVPILDSAGLAALTSFYKSIQVEPTLDVPIVRLLHPQPAVQQMIELTRLHHFFEVVVDGLTLPAPVLQPGSPARAT